MLMSVNPWPSRTAVSDFDDALVLQEAREERAVLRLAKIGEAREELRRRAAHYVLVGWREQIERSLRNHNAAGQQRR